MNGIELYTDLLLTPWEAALGTRSTIETIDDTVSVYVPQGIQSGERVRIPGRGDLIAEVKIRVPKKLTDEEKELFEKLSKVSKFNPKNEHN